MFDNKYSFFSPDTTVIFAFFFRGLLNNNRIVELCGVFGNYNVVIFDRNGDSAMKIRLKFYYI